MKMMSVATSKVRLLGPLFLLLVTFIGCTTSRINYYIKYEELVNKGESITKSLEGKETVKIGNAHDTIFLFMKNEEREVRSLSEITKYSFTAIDTIIKKYGNRSIEKLAAKDEKKVPKFIIVKTDSVHKNLYLIPAIQIIEVGHDDFEKFE